MAEVRGGTGFLAALELTADVLEARPTAATQLALNARRHGVLLRPLVKAVGMSPPLTADESHLALIAEALAAALAELEADVGAAAAV